MLVSVVVSALDWRSISLRF